MSYHKVVFIVARPHRDGSHESAMHVDFKVSTGKDTKFSSQEQGSVKAGRTVIFAGGWMKS
ncbi:hypothetical protein PUNSTDRAFT_52380 [Punctularia strigosozonata HHB-11173 SS5]|uniref:uncharacterized protein n=1 Tax=Punctularia strigosozonata (strain HHB-11173) TaxID=741275 RepID=UPI0004417757|nr:uncharacterized protein PUNSTDRAFT_52380 [Punctularia strigosozonata HHB-11173 SS5]EIN08919.1 hypothetical protein PUNSTDRAFT_52380 [Punctularia strigosozonata HHB-11173 SS5]